MRTFLSKLRALFTRSHSSEEEFETHLALLTERFIARRMPPEEAAFAARRQFGNSDLHQQNLRDHSRFLLLSHLWRDLRYAVRGMLRNPGFAVTAILTLALGMGANIAVFALLDAVLLRSLPVAHPQRLYFVDYAGATGVGISPPYPFLQRMQADANLAQQNKWNAVNVLSGVAAQDNPLGYASAATGEANASTSAADSVANLSNAETNSQKSGLLVFSAESRVGSLGPLGTRGASPNSFREAVTMADMSDILSGGP